MVKPYYAREFCPMQQIPGCARTNALGSSVEKCYHYPCKSCRSRIFRFRLRRTKVQTIEQEMKGKVAIITGAGSGIGFGCAEVFCASGVNVVIAEKNVRSGEKAAADLNHRGGGNALFFGVDVSQPDQVEALMEFTLRELGRLDTLINNAGFQHAHHTASDMPLEAFHDTLRVNLTGAFYCCKYAIPPLRLTRGSIINMSSILSQVAQEGTAAYTASKGGIISMTKAIAIEEARHGVRVNAICPGHIITPLYHEIKSRSPDPEAYEERCNNYSWTGRGGTPEDIGKVALFLASSWADYVTGTHINVTGALELGTMPKQYNFE